MLDTLYNIFSGIFGNIYQVYLYVWWLILPLFLFYLFGYVWMIYVRTYYIRNIKWSVLEIKIPKEILKSPKAMETVFSNLYSAYSYGLNRYATYWDGRVEPWFSFEIVGFSSGIYFYAYIPKARKNAVESAIYSQYPDAEIEEVEDYTNLLPAALPNEVYDVFGTEFHLARESYLSIRTYQHFEDPTEEKRLDPLSAVAEAMTKLKNDEFIWIQLLFSPTGKADGSNWKEEGEERIGEIVGRQKKKKKGILSGFYDWIKNFLWAPVELPVWPGGEKPKEAAMKFLSPDEQEMVKEIANKISKLGFKAFIRFVYVDRRDSFTPANAAAVFGAFHQFNTQNLNAFRIRYITFFDSFLARISSKYKNFRLLYKKRRLFDWYKQRRFGRYNKIRDEKFSIMNTEELATIFHFPTVMVGAPKVRRIEAKKGSPPPDLPIEL